ncbi:MAG: hypothetical protein JWQ29_85 [Phenylobacterium sp.]|nr:hypothetical protein [Phenylobacterium sp.]
MAISTRTGLAAIAASLGLGAAAPPLKPPAAPAPPVVTAATGYYVIRRTEEAWTVMDPNAIERVPGGPVRRSYSVTVRRNLLNGGPPQPGYVRTLNEYDCDARRFRWRSFTIYNRFGAVVVKQDNADPTFGPPDPGGEEDTSLRVVCEGAGGGSVVTAPSLGKLVIGLMQAWDDAAMAAPLQAIAAGAGPKPELKRPDAKRPDGKKQAGAKKPPARPAKTSAPKEPAKTP